ncbi:MAG: hypothetical protein IPN57_08885 [Ignavibacteria bacterium]|nr:hypothetical protein [Ignavibacteria bacterium]
MFDITGREVQTPVNESLNSGTYETKLDAAQFICAFIYRNKKDDSVKIKNFISSLQNIFCDAGTFVLSHPNN